MFDVHRFFHRNKDKEIYQELINRIQRIATLEEAGAVLSDIQSSFVFSSYFVLDMSRLVEPEPISFLYPSNVPAALFHNLDERLPDVAMQLFMQPPGNFGPVRWDLGETIAAGDIGEDAAELFRSYGMTMGASFPALGISGSLRLIGFSGGRAHLELEEIEKLNLLMIHMHERLNIIGRMQGGQREPLSDLERQVLFLTADGESFEIISARMSLSPRTIQYLVDSICRKMEVATMEHAVAIALRRSLIM